MTYEDELQRITEMVDSAEQLRESFNRVTLEKIERRAEKFGVEVVRVATPIHLDCDPEDPHLMVVKLLHPDRIDQWLEHEVGDRLPIMRADRLPVTGEGDYMIRARICKCVGPRQAA